MHALDIPNRAIMTGFLWTFFPVKSQHAFVCVLALLIERVAELSCGKPWHQIQEALDRVQATKFENSSHRFIHRNEINSETYKIFKSLKIKAPKKGLEIEKIQ